MTNNQYNTDSRKVARELIKKASSSLLMLILIELEKEKASKKAIKEVA